MTIRFAARLVLAMLVTTAGCVLSKSSLGDTSPGNDDEDSSAQSSGEASSGSGESDSGSTTTVEPGSTTAVDPGSESSTEGSSGSQHAACMSPAPNPLPQLPSVDRLPGGAPTFTAWEALTEDCEALPDEFPVCQGGACGASDQCIGEDGNGVCASSDIDIWCDGEGYATGFGEGCFACLAPEQHARGCCEVSDVFDCRTWPFAGTSGPDMICATHEDCEAGLVCASPHSLPTGYGICRCPEDVGTDVTLPGCFEP